MGAKKDSEQELVNSGENVVPADDEGKGISRRKFTRNALVGSAVLLTLGNRSALGAPVYDVCISTNLLASYANGTASGLTTEQINTIEDFNNRNYDPNTIPNSDFETGTQSCYRRRPE